MFRVVRFERLVDEDSLRNELERHVVIHDWLANSGGRDELEAFNARVYAELFLTPNDDPWLGLLSSDVHEALLNHGVTDSRER